MSDILLKDQPDYEIKINGHVLMRVGRDGIDISGHDFHRDMRDLSEIHDIIERILSEAKRASRPRLVRSPAKRTAFKKSA